MLYQNKNQEIRSCIQKAVRRGDSALAVKSYDYLIKNGDSECVRKRLPVIAFEECWGRSPNPLNCVTGCGNNLINKSCRVHRCTSYKINLKGKNETIYSE